MKQEEISKILTQALSTAKDGQVTLSATLVTSLLNSLPSQIAWESKTPFFTRYITNERYQKLGPSFQKWYKPYNCTTCNHGDSNERSNFL